MRKPLLATKLRNNFKKVGNYEYYFKNIIINGRKTGCSGFILNPLNQKIVYINTEASCYKPLSDKIMYRKAESLSDYSGRGGYNQWCYENELVEKVIKLLS